MEHTQPSQSKMRPWVRDTAAAIGIGAISGIILAAFYYAFLGGF